MLLQFTGPELIVLATRGVGLPAAIQSVLWTDLGARLTVDASQLGGDSLTARLATRAAGVVQIDLTFADFAAPEQVLSFAVSAHARSMSMDRLLHLFEGHVNAQIAKDLAKHDLPIDTAKLCTSSDTPIFRVEVGRVLTQFLADSPFPTAKITAVDYADDALKVEVDLVP